MEEKNQSFLICNMNFVILALKNPLLVFLQFPDMEIDQRLQMFYLFIYLNIH